MHSPLRQKHFRAVVAALLGVGFVVGTIEVLVPAQADGSGGDALAGVLLGAFACGSGIGGALYGSRTWRTSLPTRFIAVVGSMAVLFAMLGLAPNAIVLGIGLAIVGGALAPATISGYLLADQVTDESVHTEASTWINTAINAGAAVAAAATGALLGRIPHSALFLASGVVAALCLAGALPGLTRLRRQLPTAD